MLMQADEQQLYDELEWMGVNLNAVRSANLTKEELAALTNALRNLLVNSRNRRMSANRVMLGE